MRSRLAVMVLIPVVIFTLIASTHAAVEWDLFKTYKVDGTPLDAAISLNGRWIFVLTDQSEIHIFSPDGTRKEKISVGDSIDGIKPGPRDDILLLSSRKDKTVQIITLDFIQDINIAGSPFKGPADAPVVIAVFTDFE
jgi:hypothetical protein